MRQGFVGSPKKSLRDPGADPPARRLSGQALADVLADTAPRVSIKKACLALGVSRATYYRRQNALTPPSTPTAGPCRVPGRALTKEEQERVWEHLHSERFQDKAPPQIVAILQDEGEYLCSVSTMYRLLRSRNEVDERRRQRKHAIASRPELLATGPKQVWSWDITKLKGPRKWSYFYLYVILDIFSRYVVGWCIEEKENAALAEALIFETLLVQQIEPGSLTLHADRGSAMTSTSVATLLVELGVEKSHSRPHTSDDNPFSESHFKTLKYRPDIPERFASAQEARVLFRDLFVWYNTEHRHCGIAMLPPALVHDGSGPRVLAARAVVLDAAYSAHPERFVNKRPVPDKLAEEVWINPPLPPAQSSREDTAETYVPTPTV